MLYTARYTCKIVEEKLITHKLYLDNLLIPLLGKLLCKGFLHTYLHCYSSSSKQFFLIHVQQRDLTTNRVTRISPNSYSLVPLHLVFHAEPIGEP